MMSWTTQITGIWDPQEEQLEATNTKQVHLEVPGYFHPSLALVQNAEGFDNGICSSSFETSCKLVHIPHHEDQ